MQIDSSDISPTRLKCGVFCMQILKKHQYTGEKYVKIVDFGKLYDIL